MTLNFPNLSRSYDPTRRRVRFWGYDSALEITFFIEAGAILKLAPATECAEDPLLQVFDDRLDRIHEAAGVRYSRMHGFTHTLTAEDF